MHERIGALLFITTGKLEKNTVEKPPPSHSTVVVLDMEQVQNTSAEIN